jgi:hypothetical protein
MDSLIREELQAALAQNMPDASTFTLANLQILAVTVNNFVAQIVGYCHTHPHKDEQMRIIGEQIQQHTYEVILGWLEQSAMAQDGSAASIAAALSWAIFGMAFHAALTRDKQSPEQVADHVITFLTPSLQIYLLERL